jgi:hypothetical protein
MAPPVDAAAELVHLSLEPTVPTAGAPISDDR